MNAKELAEGLRENVRKVIRGKDEVIDLAVLCVLADGHILLEDVPGTGKTTLVRALAASLQLPFKRIQFTPDLLPSDLTGVNIYDPESRTFTFRPGPVFTGILLADEVNRATPRTQSGLLECMEERCVTVDGETRPLPEPFLVAATQNPVEIQGTFPLPEAQLDRFLMRLSVGYPDAESEREMLTGFERSNPLKDLTPVADREALLEARREVRAVHAEDSVKEYMLRIAAATRENDRVRLGVSPRGSLALLHACQARAAALGRDYVIPEDVKTLTQPVLGHRLLCKGAAHDQKDTAALVLRQILSVTPVPEIR